MDFLTLQFINLILNYRLIQVFGGVVACLVEEVSEVFCHRQDQVVCQCAILHDYSEIRVRVRRVSSSLLLV